MRNRKRVFAQFTFHDRTGIQYYLEKMALKGWMLDKITKWSWHFRRIEPRRVHFAVSYFAKTSSFEPEPPEELLRFRDFCDLSLSTALTELSPSAPWMKRTLSGSRSLCWTRRLPRSATTDIRGRILRRR